MKCFHALHTCWIQHQHNHSFRVVAYQAAGLQLVRLKEEKNIHKEVSTSTILKQEAHKVFAGLHLKETENLLALWNLVK